MDSVLLVFRAQNYDKRTDFLVLTRRNRGGFLKQILSIVG